MAITLEEIKRLKALEEDFGISNTLEKHVGVRYEDYIKPSNYGGNTVNMNKRDFKYDHYLPNLEDQSNLHYLRSFISNPVYKERFGFREENFTITDNSPEALAVSDINSIIAHGSHLLGGFYAGGQFESKIAGASLIRLNAFVYTNEMKRSVNTYFKPARRELSDGYFFPVWVDCYLREGLIFYKRNRDDTGRQTTFNNTITRDDFKQSDNFVYSPPLNNFTKLENIGEFKVGGGYFGKSPSEYGGYPIKDVGDFLNDSTNPTVSAHANRKTLVSKLNEIIGPTLLRNWRENAFYRFPNVYGLNSGLNIETYTETLKNKWMGRIEELIRLRIKFVETFVPKGSFKNEFIKNLNYILNNLRGLIRVVKKHNFIAHSSLTDKAQNDFIVKEQPVTEFLRYYVYVVHGVEIPDYEMYNKIHTTRIEIDKLGGGTSPRQDLDIGDYEGDEYNSRKIVFQLKNNLLGEVSRDLEFPYPDSGPIALPPTQEEYDALPSDSITKAYFPRYKYAKLKGREVTPESIITAFKEMVLDPMNNLRLRNKNHPARQPFHEFLSDKLFVNYDGVLYTQDDIRYNRLESRRKIASNDPMLFLGNPVTSEVLNDIYLYHKDEYLADKIPDNKAFVKYVYDTVRKLTLGKIDNSISVKNTLNALGTIAESLSCIGTLEILYTDKDPTSNLFTAPVFNNPFHDFDDINMLVKLKHLQSPYVRVLPEITKSEELRPYYYFAILDPRYALEGVMVKYKDLWLGQTLSERKVNELFTKVANDLMNNALKVRRMFIHVRDAQRGYMENGTWHHVWGRRSELSPNSYQLWGSSCIVRNLDFNMVTRSITHVRLRSGYKWTNASGSGIHFRISAINRATLAEDLRDEQNNVINFDNPLAYWNGQYGHYVTRDSDLMKLKRSIPPTYMIRLYAYKQGDTSGDAVNVDFTHIKDVAFGD